MRRQKRTNALKQLWRQRMTVNRERKMVAREQTYVSFEYDTLETVLKQVKQLIKDYGPNAKIISRCEPYSDSDKENMYVYVDKPDPLEA